MRNRDYTDIIGGGLLVVVGVACGWYATRYNLGSLTRMGPGFFPTVLGYLLAFLGLLVLLPALRRAGDAPVVHWRPLITILLSIAVFGMTVRQIGVVPATFLMVGISTAAQPGFRPLRTLVLAIALSTLAVVIFLRALGVLLPMFNWPF
jgi:hypothetical protein